MNFNNGKIKKIIIPATKDNGLIFTELIEKHNFESPFFIYSIITEFLDDVDYNEVTISGRDQVEYAKIIEWLEANKISYSFEVVYRVMFED